MQLKGLVRFFTILLILYSIYELSFTWVVRSHEKKMETRAQQFVDRNYRNADPATKEQAKAVRLKRLLDSTKEETVHYGFTGAISYDKAKKEELNLGLDLKGGMNVTMQVELSGLIKALSNNSKDPVFLKAIENANVRKANSSEDYISLFVEEYKKLNPNGRLAAIFAAGGDRIKITDSDETVISEIRESAGNAFDNTFNVLSTRIDQFGVAQPNINPDKQRDIITIELPGVKDPERIRQLLITTANLQFWEVYKTEEVLNGWIGAESAYNAIATGKVFTDTTGSANDTTGKNDSLSKPDTNTKITKSLFQDFKFNPQQGVVIATKDTGAFREVLNHPAIRRNFPTDAKFLYGIPNRDDDGKKLNIVPLYIIKTKGSDKPPIEGDVVTSASMRFEQGSSSPSVSMSMNPSGSVKWEQLTETSSKETRPIAIVLDEKVYSAPIAHNGKISGGQTSITGNFTVDEAKDLALILEAGRLPTPAKIVADQVVGPTLGQDAIRGGVMAFAISFIVIFILMLVYYNTSGWIANIALILNLLFTIGVLTGLGATLTAPGIAGLVLTIGMAVDTNVIIYERIKEELTNGKSYVQAVNEGYRRSLPPVLDAHVTTLLTAIILFSFGLGPVKGFATTQIIGIILSLFCGILVSRWVTDWFTNKKRHLEYFTPISKRIFKHASYKFIEYRKVAYVISVVVFFLGIAAIFHGFDQGVEFKGGRSYQIGFQQPVGGKIEDIRNDLSETFKDEGLVIKTIRDDRHLDITTTYLINKQGADAEVQTKLFEGLRKYLPANTTAEQFSKPPYTIGLTKVEPTISEKLKNDAKWATFWSVMIIALYIFIRFRDWRYSVGTIVALMHDVFVTLAVFSFLRHFVSFPLELDQHFIAAILTVIGFSMNDTVIVYDRIREYSRKMVGAPKEVIINKAINETLSRTIMTSLTVFLTILILFIFGGDVTRGFAFAMLIGVITGSYSSIFVAAPVLVDLGGKKALGSETAAEKKKSAQVKPDLAKH